MTSSSKSKPVANTAAFSIGGSLIPDFTFTIGIMFLESFLAGNTKLSAKERKSITDTVLIVKRYLLKQR